MPEQFEFDFKEITTPPKETPEEELQRLAKEYKKIFGPNPIERGFDRTTILNALKNQEKEHVRLHEIDTESDHEEIRRTYRR